MILAELDQIKHIRIATRKSNLALWQANYVAKKLRNLYPYIKVSLIKKMSEGDKKLDTSLMKIGGKGLFIKELESTLLNNEADIAVHSMKDVPIELPNDLFIPVICKREKPYDALVSIKYKSLLSLPQGAIIGTSSLRRQCQILTIRPDLKIKLLRGNVDTRLSRLDGGEYDAIILAYAGLKRLGMSHRITETFPEDVSLPAAGQGAIGIEMLKKNVGIIDLIKPLHDKNTAICVNAERRVNILLNASCHVPVASYARVYDNSLTLKSLVGQPDGTKIIRAEATVTCDKYIEAGNKVSKMLLDRGAKTILDSL